MINFGSAFENAWERMVHMLFRPFSIEKWFAIGLSAFLAGLLVGGNGISGFQFPNTSDFNKQNNNNTYYHAAPTHHFFVDNHATPFQFVDDEPSSDSVLGKAMAGVGIVVIILVALVFLVFIIALQVLFAWLGSRGQFMFLDNIVRNRAAISDPWERYAVQAHSLFKLFVIYLVCSYAVVIVMLIPVGILLWPVLAQNAALATPAILGLVGLGLFTVVILIPIAFIYFNYIEFGVPIMFRNGTLAVPALFQVLDLIKHHFVTLVIYALIRFGLWIGVIFCTVLLCCVCCIGIIPYIGTVALLPALVFVRSFSLEVLAQLNPEFSVWTVPGAVTPLPPRG